MKIPSFADWQVARSKTDVTDFALMTLSVIQLGRMELRNKHSSKLFLTT